VCYFLTVGIPANARDVVTLFDEAGAHCPALSPKVRKLHDALTKMVDVVGTVHLYGRVYHGDQDREQVSPTGHLETTLSAFLHDEGRYAEDVVLTLRAG
jgi:hypothetical protein